MSAFNAGVTLDAVNNALGFVYDLGESLRRIGNQQIESRCAYFIEAAISKLDDVKNLLTKEITTTSWQEIENQFYKFADKKKLDPKAKGKKKMPPWLKGKDKKSDKKDVKKSKKSSYYDALLNKFGANGQVKDTPEAQAYAKNLTDSTLQSINAINIKQLSPADVEEYVKGYKDQATNYFNGDQITALQWSAIARAGQEKIESAKAAQTTTAPGGTFTAKLVDETPSAKPVAPAKKLLPKINLEVQKALNYLGFVGKDYKPLDPDGLRGPNTDFALGSFSKSTRWQNLLNMQPNATVGELGTLALQAKQMKESGKDKEAPTDFTKGPTIGQPPAAKWDPGF
jgi:hypothetical protein